MLINAKTVLKGEDSESRISFFKANGSGNLNPRTNPWHIYLGSSG